jgi:hypothetical protein
MLQDTLKKLSYEWTGVLFLSRTLHSFVVANDADSMLGLTKSDV